MTLHKLAVGELYKAGRTRWDERTDFSIRGDRALFRMFMARPTSPEVQVVRRGPTEWGWVGGDHGALLLYKIDDRKQGRIVGWPWSDQPYHAAREPEAPEPTGPNGRAMVCSIILVDAATGIIKALRDVGWPADAADMIRATIATHHRLGYNARAEAAWVQGMYTRYPGVEGGARLARERADITWEGGTGASTPGTSELSSPISSPPPARSGMHPVAAELFGQWHESGHEYPKPLPVDLAPWYLYTADAGHSIVVAPRSEYAPGRLAEEVLVPASVATVLRTGWETSPEGWIVADVEYHQQMGVTTPTEEYEY